MKNALYVSRFADPYFNLASEERLCRQCDGVTLFLWQNHDTVVIGRNQSALRECDLAALRRDGVKLARRTTGGGAVFHDDGNLNFSVIFPSESMDKSVGYGIVRRGLDLLGISTAVSGRNDLLLADGRKFSGSAFRLSGGVFLHHGTLLVRSELDRMGTYLRPTAEKLRAHGVESVRARVANLAELRSVTVEDVENVLAESFRALYGACELREVPADTETEELRRHLASETWIVGKEPKADLTLEHRFDWGEVTLLLTAAGGVVTGAKAYTDGMDPFFSGKLEACLTGQPLRAAALADAAEAAGLTRGEAVASWLRAMSF